MQVPANGRDQDREIQSNRSAKIGNARRPNVSPAFLFLFGTGILFPGANECPDFIALQTANAKIANVVMVISGARTAKIVQQLKNCMFCDTGHAFNAAA